MTKFIAISGSLRKDSVNTKLLKAIQKINPEINFELVDIGIMPLFNQDLEENYPVEIQAIKNKIKASDGVIFVTPEYNRSIPGVLKNAIDWLSRPYGTNAFDQKPVLVAGASNSPVGTALAQSHLKQTLLFLNTHLMGQPELYVFFADEKFDENGELTDEKTKNLIMTTIEKFVEFSKKFSS